MQITSNEICNTKYIQIYLTEDELKKQEIKEIIDKYKKEKYSLAIFTTGKENYPEILKKKIANRLN